MTLKQYCEIKELLRKLAPSTESIDDIIDWLVDQSDDMGCLQENRDIARQAILDLIKQSQLDLLNNLKTKKVKGANLVELKWIDEALLKIKEDLDGKD